MFREAYQWWWCHDNLCNVIPILWWWIHDEGPWRRYFFCRRAITSQVATLVVALLQPHMVAFIYSSRWVRALPPVRLPFQLLRAPASSAPARAPDFIRSRHDVYLHPFSASCTCQCCDNVIQWWCMMMSNVMLRDDDVRSVVLSSCLVLRGSWCRRHSLLLLHQLGGYGILPLVCTFFRRHVDYGTSHLRSPIFGSHFIYGTQLSFVSILHPWCHVVRGTPPPNLRELRVLQPPWTQSFRTSAFYILRVQSSRHSVAIQYRVMSSRPSVAPRRAAVQSSKSNFADVQSCWCSIVEVQPRRHSTMQLYSSCIRFHVTAVTVFQPLLMQILRRELFLPRSSLVISHSYKQCIHKHWRYKLFTQDCNFNNCYC